MALQLQPQWLLPHTPTPPAPALRACLSPVTARRDNAHAVLVPQARVPTVSFLSLFYLESQ